MSVANGGRRCSDMQIWRVVDRMECGMGSRGIERPDCVKAPQDKIDPDDAY